MPGKSGSDPSTASASHTCHQTAPASNHIIPSAQPRRLSLCNDIVFKTLFSRHLNLLSDLINAVRHPLPPLIVQRVLNPHVLPADLIGKEIVLDILAEDTDGQRLAIEMQLQRFLHWPERSVYGIARSLAGQLNSGQDYRQLKPCIGINLLVHDLFPEHPDQANWHFTLRDTGRGDVQLGLALQLHIIELRKAQRHPHHPESLRAWMTCLLHNLDEAAMSTITHPPVKDALQKLEHLYSDEELRLMAERREQALIDAEDIRDYARHEGFREGRQEGLQQGLQEGRQQGLQEGHQEGLSSMLESLLSHKFGPLPTRVIERLHSSDTEQIRAWSLNVLDAQTLDEVFR
ncbi:Rpn family recombination-promoting nuclease/putative transposase [Castellaniella sp. S9]|uniref:Rpn family recombination-promoting nuclease/putative transposase n=1 Tax=Castellaniella sp. S9 TaxID=2993652 RepID=UPI0022B5D06F|nr:Rpn family recombination-promoting nuclease/putative transposase [Castellaniella sp. S9]